MPPSGLGACITVSKFLLQPEAPADFSNSPCLPKPALFLLHALGPRSQSACSWGRPSRPYVRICQDDRGLVTSACCCACKDVEYRNLPDGSLARISFWLICGTSTRAFQLPRVLVDVVISTSLEVDAAHAGLQIALDRDGMSPSPVRVVGSA